MEKAKINLIVSAALAFVTMSLIWFVFVGADLFGQWFWSLGVVGQGLVRLTGGFLIITGISWLVFMFEDYND